MLLKSVVKKSRLLLLLIHGDVKLDVLTDLSRLIMLKKHLHDTDIEAIIIEALKFKPGAPLAMHMLIRL